MSNKFRNFRVKYQESSIGLPIFSPLKKKRKPSLGTNIGTCVSP